MVEYQATTRFHARPGAEADLLSAVLGILPPVRAEPRCTSVHAFRAVDDPRLFFITSRWPEQSAYVQHRAYPHTQKFLEAVQQLVDEPIESTYITPIG